MNGDDPGGPCVRQARQVTVTPAAEVEMSASMDPAALKAQVRDSYATAEALAVYRTRVDQGLRICF